MDMRRINIRVRASQYSMYPPFNKYTKFGRSRFGKRPRRDHASFGNEFFGNKTNACGNVAFLTFSLPLSLFLSLSLSLSVFLSLSLSLSFLLSFSLFLSLFPSLSLSLSFSFVVSLASLLTVCVGPRISFLHESTSVVRVCVLCRFFSVFRVCMVFLYDMYVCLCKLHV